MPEPTVATVAEIKLRRRSRVLEVTFGDGSCHALPFEYLRVHSPSAEVQGHGPGEGVLVVGKEQVGLRAIEPVGQYAVRLVFDDGHDTGLYTWKYLHELAVQQPQKWGSYLARCARAGHVRRTAADAGNADAAGAAADSGERGQTGSSSIDKERPG